jgi:DNA processing protein
VPAPLRADAAGRTGPRALRHDHPHFPAGFRDLRDPPPVVFMLGAELPTIAGAVAMVGSRAASRYGLDQAHRLAHDLARLGMVVVSGLARGIDAAAHRGALAAGGRTVAVLPSGLDAITPRHHRALAAEIARAGTLLTEWERGEPAGKGVFVQRNRLIAALAGATVVVEAAERSGALSTATFARRLGRPVLAVPGDVDRETARGALALLRGGARLCEHAGDVMAAMGAGRTDRPRPEMADMAAEPPATPEARVLAALGGEPATVDRLAAAAGLPVPTVLAALLALQWAGAARPHPGQRWVRGTT